MFTRPKRNYFEQQFYTKTETQFYQLHHYYPHEIYIMLLNMGFTSKAFQFIQAEIDRLYTLQKIESEFTPLDEFTDESPF